jgi:hypothetical protein
LLSAFSVGYECPSDDFSGGAVAILIGQPQQLDLAVRHPMLQLPMQARSRARSRMARRPFSSRHNRCCRSS